MKAFCTIILGLTLIPLASLPLNAQATQPGEAATAKKTGVLSAETVQQLMPSSVFFSGQSASVQIRNSSGYRFADGKLMLAGLVDTGGYSTSVREKYQFYLITETALSVDGHRLVPGAYGCGFVGGKFLVMDIGGGDLMQGPTTSDSGMKRPRPLQLVASDSEGELKIYLGREFVAVKRSN